MRGKVGDNYVILPSRKYNAGVRCQWYCIFCPSISIGNSIAYVVAANPMSFRTTRAQRNIIGRRKSLVNRTPHGSRSGPQCLAPLIAKVCLNCAVFNVISCLCRGRLFWASIPALNTSGRIILFVIVCMWLLACLPFTLFVDVTLVNTYISGQVAREWKSLALRNFVSVTPHAGRCAITRRSTQSHEGN